MDTFDGKIRGKKSHVSVPLSPRIATFSKISVQYSIWIELQILNHFFLASRTVNLFSLYYPIVNPPSNCHCPSLNLSSICTSSTNLSSFTHSLVYQTFLFLLFCQALNLILICQELIFDKLPSFTPSTNLSSFTQCTNLLSFTPSTKYYKLEASHILAQPKPA